MRSLENRNLPGGNVNDIFLFNEVIVTPQNFDLVLLIKKFPGKLNFHFSGFIF